LIFDMDAAILNRLDSAGDLEDLRFATSGSA
jgi:hypothetical protein